MEAQKHFKEIVEDQMTIYLEDDLVAPNVPGFNDSVTSYCDEMKDLQGVILSLASVKNIDSIGVTFVISLYKRVMKLNVAFRIHDASDNVKQLFKLMKLDDWNDVIIIATENHIRHYLNGKLVLDFTDNHPEMALTKGLLALQLHGGAPMWAEFKNIRVRSIE